MNPIQNLKFVSVTPPAAIIDNASATTAYVDTAGWDHALFVIYFGAMDIAATAMKLQECDTSGGSYADITGTVFGTSTNTDGSTSTLPSATDDNKFFAISVNTAGRKRYLDLVLTLGDGAAGTYVTVFCILSRGDTDPSTAAGRGFSQVLRV